MESRTLKLVKQVMDMISGAKTPNTSTKSRLLWQATSRRLRGHHKAEIVGKSFGTIETVHEACNFTINIGTTERMKSAVGKSRSNYQFCKPFQDLVQFQCP